jgi:hypothetical protein
VCPLVDVDTLAGSYHNSGNMIEHGFLAAMLALVGLEVVAVGYLAYLTSRVLERVEGITAATYLEVRKALAQPR